MKNFEKLLGVVVAGLAIVLVCEHAGTALGPTLPKDMPRQARFLQSGFDISHLEAKGDWVACGLDRDGHANWCKITDSVGTVLYQGDFMPVAGQAPVPIEALTLRQTNPDRLFVKGPESAPIPAITLQSGAVLVPEDDAMALSARWAKDPDELNAIEQGR